MRQSDRSDFARIYDEHVWRVYGFVGYRVKSRADAEDLTQLTFERALRAWGRFDPRRASAGTWLLSIARNLIIDHYRQDRSGAQHSLERESVRREVEQASPVPAPDLGLDTELASALGTLSEREREILALRFGGELNGPEIAELTGLTLANVQQILSRSLRKLRHELSAPVAIAG